MVSDMASLVPSGLVILNFSQEFYVLRVRGSQRPRFGRPPPASCFPVGLEALLPWCVYIVVRGTCTSFFVVFVHPSSAELCEHCSLSTRSGIDTPNGAL